MKPDAPTGLTQAEAAARLSQDGPNELPSRRRWSFAFALLEIVREPMTFLLVGCGAVYMVLGDLHEALMLLGFVGVIVAITLVQERKTERALEALRDLASPRALVVRGGARRRIPGREVVVGDLVVVEEGDRVPADLVLLEASHLRVDESLLTGESVPVRKMAAEGALPEARPGGDDLPFAYSGTLVVQGSALGRVRATGPRTEIGRIGKALQVAEPEDTQLQKATRRLVTRLAFAGGVVSVLVVVASALSGRGWLEGVLAGLTLAMAIMPNELPVVVVVFLALGARRLARRRVLTRRMPAVEALGAATVLCVDKTGTLTENRMAIRRLVAGPVVFDTAELAKGPLPSMLHELVDLGILASRREPFDPMEVAFVELGARTLPGPGRLRPRPAPVREYPLSRALLAVTHVYRTPGEPGLLVATKGAPEAVADLCRLDAGQRRELAARVDELAAEGLRVLAVAHARAEAEPLPDDPRAFRFTLAGLVGLEDPVRAAVPAAVGECRTAGIRVVMITGDYPETARSVARKAGLDRTAEVITGPELAAMSDEALARRIGAVSVFARVQPEQKLRIVRALQGAAEVAAMTGDGVNDAPALQAATIGIAMGGRGTDVAREASSLVLLDDDFASLVEGVKTGRRILDNLKSALAYVLAVHVPIVGLTLVPILMGWPLVLLPAHVTFLQLVIDPACSVVFEAEPSDADVMRRPPRDPEEPLFSTRAVALSLLQGVSVLAIVLAVFAIALHRGQGAQDARALTFTTLVVANLALILTNRSWSRTIASTVRRPNPALWWVSGGALVLLGLVLYVPVLRGLFRFSVMHVIDLVICLTAGLFSVAWFEGLKLVARRRGRAAPEGARRAT